VTRESRPSLQQTRTLGIGDSGESPKIKYGKDGTIKTEISERDKIYPLTDNLVAKWYQQSPYVFEFTPRSGGKKSRFFLPIAPSNLSISTNFATNIIPTMYGTVEEHSEVRYFDINISGTTGMVPKYWDVEDVCNQTKSRISGYVEGRAPFPVKQALNTRLGGFAKRTIGLLEKAANTAADFLELDSDPGTAVDPERTGYVAFHNFYRWLLLYKQDVSGEKGIRRRTAHPLKFINYKDNNMYDVAIVGFSLNRSAADPMLYNYSITMRGYNLRGSDEKEALGVGPGQRAADLGLIGKDSSIFNKMSSKVSKAKNFGYSVVGAVKGLGS
jgi:hypothetical protein